MQKQMIKEIKEETTFSASQVERYLTSILIQLEIPSKNKGFFFTKECAKIAYFNPTSRFHINEQIFKTLADKYGTSCSKIERSIRHALTIATAQKKMSNFEKMFGAKDNFSLLHPSVGEFISLLAESIHFANPKDFSFYPQPCE